jgi:hypothetical protein
MAMVLDGTSGITTNSGTLLSTSDATINGLTVGKGGGNTSTNTVHGVSALAATNTIGNCTAFGYQALTLTTGKQNTAVGASAGASMTTGEGLAAFGWNAANLNTADNVTALGHNTLGVNTTGANNTAVGNAALNVNTTGGLNTAVGRQALVSNTTASNNTAVGYQAGYANVLGTNNTFIGYSAGHESSAATTTGYNTAVGAYAGYSLTTGTRNTFIGSFQSGGTAGSGSAITTGSANSILGAYTGNGGSLDIRTSSNQIVLSDGDGNPRLWGDSGGSWMFGTSRSFARGLVDIPTSGGNAGIPLAISRGGDGGAFVQFYSTNSTTTVIGNIYNNSNTSTAYNTSSDYRLKENITPMTGALAKVAQLKPVTYKWKSNGSDGQGFIAHELAEVVPDCVTGAKDAVDADGNPVYQGIDTSYLVATLTKAIQELKTIVDAQAAEIAELKTKVM